MDSLLANYASSDEEEQKQHSKPLVLKSEAEEEQDFPSKNTSRPSGIFSSLPPPKSSLFNSLPPQKSQSFPNQTNYLQQDEQIDDQVRENSKPKASSSSLFSSLPPPKSSTSASSSSSSTKSKKVVQFRPPPMINPFSSGVNDEDGDEDEEERQRKRSKASLSTSSTMSFLSSMPAPKNSATLGAMPSALGSGRRCIIESEARDSNECVTGSDKVVRSNVGFVNDQSDEINYDNSSWSLGSKSTTNYSAIESFHGENVASAVVSSVMENDDGCVDSNLGSSEVKSDELNYDYSGRISGSESYYNRHNGGQFVSVGPEAVDYSYRNEDHLDYQNYATGYGYHSNNSLDENNWADTSIMTAFPEASGGVENALNVYGKRGRRDAPQDIVEVKQDELMKNRARENQTKMTGIAFGPAYQPTSTKGKPSKLHKRKHQIGSLLFDMKQKEMELAERRSKGYATKAQTQAKYGW